MKNILEDSSNKKELNEVLFNETGKEWHIKLVDGKAGNNVAKPKTENDIGIDINVID